LKGDPFSLVILKCLIFVGSEMSLPTTDGDEPATVLAEPGLRKIGRCEAPLKHGVRVLAYFPRLLLATEKR
jgi:hypothetical protein